MIKIYFNLDYKIKQEEKDLKSKSKMIEIYQRWFSETLKLIYCYCLYVEDDDISSLEFEVISIIYKKTRGKNEKNSSLHDFAELL